MVPTSSLKFEYQAFPASPNDAFPDRHSVRRPVINIRFPLNGKSIFYPVLLDSGSDFCIFNAEIGDLLHIPVKSGKKMTFFGTSGTPQNAYFHTIHYELGGWDMECYAGFSYEMKTMPYGLLGQTGFFDKFRIEFNYAKKRIEIKPR